MADNYNLSKKADNYINIIIELRINLTIDKKLA